MQRLNIFAAGISLCLLAQIGRAQNQPDLVLSGTGEQTTEPCSSLPARKIEAHELRVIGVSFSGNLRMPIADQNQIAAELKQLSYAEASANATDDLVERARRAWQDRGFFRADVNGNAIPTSRGLDRGLALNAHINEGPQYRLGAI
jgi:hypothetical protein